MEIGDGDWRWRLKMGLATKQSTVLPAYLDNVTCGDEKVPNDSARGWESKGAITSAAFSTTQTDSAFPASFASCLTRIAAARPAGLPAQGSRDGGVAKERTKKT